MASLTPPAPRLTARQLSIVARERMVLRRRARVPEPMVMDEPEAVAQFDWAGAHALAPVYALCARAMSPLLPQGGTVFDLGSGSGRYLAHLARQRPDIRVVGLELSKTMLALAEETLAREGVADRVTVLHGDMTECLEFMPRRVDVVSTVFALHHLPSEEQLTRCLAQIRAASEGAGVFLFDLARLRNPRTWERLLRTGPQLPDRFLADSLASERAAWSFGEIAQAAEAAGLGGLATRREPVIGTWQMRMRGPDLPWCRAVPDPIEVADVQGIRTCSGRASEAGRGVPQSGRERP
jgi:SAM-dependent methyltransferase